MEHPTEVQQRVKPPEKWWEWKTIRLSYRVSVTFQGRTVKLRGSTFLVNVDLVCVFFLSVFGYVVVWHSLVWKKSHQEKRVLVILFLYGRKPILGFLGTWHILG